MSIGNSEIISVNIQTIINNEKSKNSKRCTCVGSSIQFWSTIQYSAQSEYNVVRSPKWIQSSKVSKVNIMQNSVQSEYNAVECPKWIQSSKMS